MKKNYYGFYHENINKKFEGGLTYISDFCVNDEYAPVAVYKVENPNREKGHKDYLLLQINYHPEIGAKRLLVRGMDQHEINKHRYQTAIRCKRCQDVIYSVMRHSMQYCNCEKVAIDGGKCYTKISGKEKDYVIGRIDLLTGEFKS